MGKRACKGGRGVRLFRGDKPKTVRTCRGKKKKNDGGAFFRRLDGAARGKKWTDEKAQRFEARDTRPIVVHDTNCRANTEKKTTKPLYHQRKYLAKATKKGIVSKREKGPKSKGHLGLGRTAVRSYEQQQHIMKKKKKEKKYITVVENRKTWAGGGARDQKRGGGTTVGTHFPAGRDGVQKGIEV